MTTALLRVQSVGKSFGSTRAVDGVSFEVQRGEIFALLGPNGAGKSTLVRMMIGMLLPDQGSVSWLDDSQKSVPFHAREIGYLPEERGLYRDQKVLRILTYFGQLRGMSRSNAEAAAKEWAERLGIQSYLNQKLETLSKGNQQKVQVAASVLHRPRLALLDEPFSGLDPLNQETMLDIIRGLRETGTTVVLSAHQLDLVERLADRVFLLAQGKRVLSGTIEEIKTSGHAGYALRIAFADGAPDAGWTHWRHAAGVLDCGLDEHGGLQMTLEDPHGVSHWIEQASKLGQVTQIRGGTLSLHEIYLNALRANPSNPPSNAAGSSDQRLSIPQGI